MKPGRRRFTVLAAVVAVAIPLTLAVMLRHRIREEWLLHCLDAAEDETRRFEILEEISRLERISPRGLNRLARAAARALREHLDDRHEGIRTQAACALWRVAGDGTAAAAVLGETVLSNSENVFRM